MPIAFDGKDVQLQSRLSLSRGICKLLRRYNDFPLRRQSQSYVSFKRFDSLSTFRNKPSAQHVYFSSKEASSRIRLAVFSLPYVQDWRRVRMDGMIHVAQKVWREVLVTAEGQMLCTRRLLVLLLAIACTYLCLQHRRRCLSLGQGSGSKWHVCVIRLSTWWLTVLPLQSNVVDNPKQASAYCALCCNSSRR